MRPLIFLLLSVSFIGPANAEFIVGLPANFGSIVNSDANENHPTLSQDGLTLYFFSNRSGGAGGTDIWTSTRQSLDAMWSPPASFSAASTSANEYVNFLSTDGTTFLYNDGGLPTEQRIYELTRATVDEPWSLPSPLPAPINDGVSSSRAGFYSEDRLTLLFESDRPGGIGESDVWEAVRSDVDEPWTVRNLGPTINSVADEVYPIMTQDGLTLVFGSPREGGFGGMDLWMSKRDSIHSEWELATNLGSTLTPQVRKRPDKSGPPATSCYLSQAERRMVLFKDFREGTAEQTCST